MKMMKYKLSEVLTGCYEGNGIFSNFINPIWVDAIPDSSDLDLYFILNYGDRPVAPVLEHFIEDGSISDINLKKVARIIYMRNKGSWEHIYKDYLAEYNPLFNTEFTETTIENRKGNGTTNNESSNKTIDSGSTHVVDTTGSTVTSTGSGSSDTNNDTYGFNTTTAVPADKSHNASNTNASTTSSGSDDNTTTTSNTTNVDNIDNGTYTNNEDVIMEHKKAGNIGVTESTQMLAHDLEFWKWSFIDRLCKDICDIIALSIYF